MSNLPSLFPLLNKQKPLIMGILNITPDSFYSDSRCFTDKKIKEKIKYFIDSKVDIIDIGAYSSRPNASYISENEEINRLSKGLKLLKQISPSIPISIDTFRSGVVSSIYKNFGNFIVNDISAGNFDHNMLNIVSKYNLTYIAMHMKGTPSTMQNQIHTKYKNNNIIEDILNYFDNKIKTMNKLGINKIIIDPGFGFSKTLYQNYELLNHLDKFKKFKLPILVGISRKSMVYKLLGCKPDQSLNGTSIVNTIALMKGANILRVHDVKEANELVKIYMAMKGFSNLNKV